VARNIAGEVILVPIHNKLGDMESIYTLNQTGALVWSMMDGQHSLAQILSQIIEEYRVDPAEAQADLLELIKQLLDIKALVQA
jgi:hypothetical protein